MTSFVSVTVFHKIKSMSNISTKHNRDLYVSTKWFEAQEAQISRQISSRQIKSFY